MIEIRINNESVDVQDDATVALSFVSPYLLYDSIPQVSVKPPALLMSPKNQRAFQFWHEPSSLSTPREALFSVYSSGELLKEGYYRISSASLSAQKYEGVFTEKLDEFFGDYQDTLLSELSLGTLAIPAILTATPVSDLSMPAVCFPSVINASYYGTSATSYSGKMNDHNGTAFVSNSPKCPHFFVKYIIAKIAQLTGTTISGSFFSHAAYQNLLFVHTRATEGATVLPINQFLPEMKVVDLFLELRKLPNLAFTFDVIEKKMTVDFWDEKLQAPTELDWSTKAQDGETKVMEQNTRIQLGYELDSNDALMKDKPTAVADYVTPQFSGQTYSGIAKVTSKFSTTLVDSATGLPIIKQEGITTINNQLTKKCSPRLLFWNGIVAGKPTAKPTYSGGFSLYWNDLKTKHWQETEALRANQFYLKKKLYLTESDIANLDFSKKIHINGVDYLLAQVDVTVPIKGASDVLLIGGL